MTIIYEALKINRICGIIVCGLNYNIICHYNFADIKAID